MAKPPRLHVQAVPTFDYDDGADDLPKIGPEFKIYGETFHCVPALPGESLPNLVRAIGVDARGVPVHGNPDVIRFMEDAIAEELWAEVAPDSEGDEPVAVLEPCDDLERWRALMRDKRRPIGAERLGKIVSDLVGFYTGLPTRPPGR